MRTLALIILMAVSFAAAAGTAQLRADAPSKYTVVKGDTLWDISARFLKSPWKWPELWQRNKDRIKNPHWIYPGDVVYLIQTPQGPKLSVMHTVKLLPSIHYQAIPAQGHAIPPIPFSAVSSFLRRPFIADEATLYDAPVLLGSNDERTLLTIGDTVYADGVTTDNRYWNIVRVGQALKDPDTGKVIAHQVTYIGDAKTTAQGTPTTLTITSVDREVEPGDRLIPATDEKEMDFEPRAPKQLVQGQIISAFGGDGVAGKYSTVVIDRGRSNGLQPGDVLGVYRIGRTIGPAGAGSRFASYDPKSGFLDADKERMHQTHYKNFGEEFLGLIDPFDFFFRVYPDGRRGWRYIDHGCLKQGAKVSADHTYDPAKTMEQCRKAKAAESHKWAYMDIGCLKPGAHITLGQMFDPGKVYQLHCRPVNVKLPDVEEGHVLLYRVFDHVAYGLVMDSRKPIYLLDTVRNP